MTFRLRIAALAAIALASLGAASPETDARLRSGLLAFRNGDVGAAHADIGAAVKADPESARPHALLGRIALALGDAGLAEAELKRARVLGVRQIDIAHLVAETMLLQGRAQDALDAAAPANVAPKFAAYAARIRAQSQRALGHAGEAQREFDLSLALGPRMSTTWVALARFRFAKGDAAGATEAVTQALRVGPRDAEALVFAGKLVRDRYGLLAALPWFDRALEVQPGRIDALFERAATLGDAGLATQMLAATRALMAASPGNAQGFYLQAVLAARAGKWDLARAVAYRISNRLDGQPGMILLRAAIEAQAGANDAAIALLRPLIEAQPSNAKVRRMFGAALWRAGDNRGAVDALSPIAINGDAYSLWISGRAMERIGDRVGAGAALDRAMRTMAVPAPMPDLDAFLGVNPADMAALGLVADRALAKGEWARAAAILESLNVRGGNSDAVRLDNLGWAYAGMGRFDEAVGAGAKAYALVPMNALTTASYGAFLRRAGERAKAVPLLEKAVALAPNEHRFRTELALAKRSAAASLSRRESGMPKQSAEFDIIVYGASGFTGRLVAEYLAMRGHRNWAMAGRSAAKLAEVRDLIGAPADTPLVEANADDPASLRAMVRKAKCIITTVGPYQLYGSDLVAACAETGTDYVDLCGEPAWMREMIDAHHANAKTSGARIVFSCGFDSIPFDLGVWKLQQIVVDRFGEPAPRIKGRVRKMQGAASGGTVASMKATMAAAAKNPKILGLLTNPFALTPGFEGPSQPSGMIPKYDRANGVWAVPFVMAPINTKNVHRTNFLLDEAFGADFRYDEMMLTTIGEAGKAMAEAIAKMNPFGDSKMPEPGEGPDKAAREAGFYEILFTAEMPGRDPVRLVVTGDRDPGYGSTSKMISESALTLIDTPSAGGVWTPGAVMAEPLLARLEANAGLSFAEER